MNPICQKSEDNNIYMTGKIGKMNWLTETSALNGAELKAQKQFSMHNWKAFFENRWYLRLATVLCDISSEKSK